MGGSVRFFFYYYFFPGRWGACAGPLFAGGLSLGASGLGCRVGGVREGRAGPSVSLSRSPLVEEAPVLAPCVWRPLCLLEWVFPRFLVCSFGFFFCSPVCLGGFSRVFVQVE